MEKAIDVATTMAETLAKPVYEDAAQPAARAVGKTLGTVLNCFNMLLSPLERAQIASSAKTEAFRKNLERKYESIPQEDRKEPDFKIVYQIMDKMKYNLESDELREKFENLLVSSMIKERTVHPLFVDILDKITANDARLLEAFYHTPEVPLSPTMCLIEFLSVGNFRGFFLSCPFILEYPGTNSRCEGDSFLFYHKDKALPQNDDAHFHLTTLANLGLICKKGATEVQSIKLDNSFNIIKDTYQFNRDEIDYTGIYQRPDILEWIKSNKLPDNEKSLSIIFKVHAYYLTTLGICLMDSLQKPHEAISDVAKHIDDDLGDVRLWRFES